MKIALACDQGAYLHKEAIKEELIKRGIEVMDFGGFSNESIDYPDTVYPAAKAVANHEADFGIVMCGTGIGASIVANKVNGIRCALVFDEETASITRQHNDSNVLAMAGRLISIEKAISITLHWLSGDFSNEARHLRRIDKITAIEEEQSHE